MAKPLHRTKAAKRERYRAKYYANQDGFAVAQATGKLEYADSNPDRAAVVSERDEAPTPAYLESPEYKRAVAEFRAGNSPNPMRVGSDNVSISVVEERW